jgi:hypothetical protein
MDTIFYVLAFGISLIFIAQYIRSYVFFIFSGVWFLGNATYIMTQEVLNFSWIFYFVLSLYLIYFGINYAIRERKIKKIGELDDERN